MNGVLGHFCAHIGETRPREPPEDGEMNAMALPLDTRFEIRDLAVWGRARYLMVTKAPYNIESLRVSWE